MTSSSTCWPARKVPHCFSSASTSVVLPWSTCATMAMPRRSGRRTVADAGFSAVMANGGAYTKFARFASGTPSRPGLPPGSENNAAVAEGGRIVYSTGRGRVCPKCGWPIDDCRCAASLAKGAEPVPEKPVAKLRLENRSSGKHVTVVAGLPDNRGFLEALARELKKACGTGGSAGEDVIELQGDQRERLRELLARKGMQVKG